MIASQTIPFSTQLKYRILRHLYFSPLSSCNDLSEALGKSLPIIARSLNELIKSGHVQEKGYAPSNGGRPPLVYSLRAENMYILAVAVDQLYTRIAVLDLANNYVVPVERIELRLLDNKDALHILARALRTCIDRLDRNSRKIIGVGIGMPGFINTRAGNNLTYLPTGTGQSLRDFLEHQLGIPVHIENDASVLALAELKEGLAKGLQDVMVIDIGWGIGLGMIINGALFRGHNGYAGELSHIPVSENNTLCDCGKRGCLETEATLRIVAGKAIREIREGRVSSITLVETPEEMSESIMQAASHGDQYAIELLSEMGLKIGKAISILIHIVNPELIILGGRGAQVGRILTAPIQQALNRYCIPRLSEHTEVKVSRLGQDASLIAAAALVMEKFGETTP